MTPSLIESPPHPCYSKSTEPPGGRGGNPIMTEPFTSTALDPEVYEHLRAIARRVYADRSHPHPTLQPTALVHEAWLKLAGSSTYQSKLHFMRAAALAMRQVVVDHERQRRARKRGGPMQRRTLLGMEAESLEMDVVELNNALSRLEILDPEAAEVVLLRCFGGLTLPEAAAVMGISERTVGTRWRHARAWLLAQITGA